jgi:glycosyltransferase involved in cell wall biosynthesis
MKISVLTVVFNRVDTIAAAIQSVTNQVYPNVEHVVVDGASSDGTLGVINANKSPDMLVFSEPDDGIYDALNKAIALSSGDIIGIMHSDDFFAHNHVLSKIAEFFTDPEIDGVYGDLDYISASDSNHIVRRWQAGSFAPAKLKRGWMPPHPTLFIRRQVVEGWGGYDIRYRIAADYDAMLRYLVKGQIKLAYIPEVLVKMRVGGESNRSLGRILLKTREDLQAMRQNGVGGLVTLACKNLSKLPQFFKR